MRINFSLSLKLTLIVVTVSAAVIFTLTYVNIDEQIGFIENTYSEKAVSFAKALDAAIEHNIELREKEILQSYISHFAQINPEILKIDVNLPEGKELMTVVSSNKDSIGNPSSSYNSLSMEKNAIVNIPDHTNNSHLISVIIPINLSGQIAGTYEILLSMEKTYAAFDLRIRNLSMIAVISLFILVFSFLFLLRKAIVKPITKVSDYADFTIFHEKQQVPKNFEMRIKSEATRNETHAREKTFLLKMNRYGFSLNVEAKDLPEKEVV